MLLDLARRYKWYLVAALLVYLGVSLWLMGGVDDAQDRPFLYLVF